MAAEHTRHGKFARNTGGVVLGATVAGFFMIPLFRLANPTTLAGGGMMLGIALVYAHEQAVEIADPKQRKLWKAMVPMMLGLLSLGWAIASAMVNGASLDRDCKLIQDAMLKGSPASAAKTRGPVPSPADQFQALGCRPQM
jgi:hypothetical protein